MNPRKKKSGKNEDVSRVIGIPFDVDPELKNNSATKAEKQKAKQNADKLVSFLKEQSYSDPYVDDSGNGYHIIQKVIFSVENSCRLENQTRNYFKEIQRVTPFKLDSIYDLARVIKVPGTLSVKGENTQERPHRTAKILSLGSSEPDRKLMEHIENIKFSFVESYELSSEVNKLENWYLIDKRFHSLNPCQKKLYANWWNTRTS